MSETEVFFASGGGRVLGALRLQTVPGEVRRRSAPTASAAFATSRDRAVAPSRRSLAALSVRQALSDYLSARPVGDYT